MKIVRPKREHLVKAGLVPWPTFHGNEQYVGTSPFGRVSVFVDSSLGSSALINAGELLMDADRVVLANDLLFGTTGSHVNVIVFALNGATDGTGGADHMGCDYLTGADIEVCASYGNSMRCSALFEAELSECSMNGQLCGLSTGEALSRWCAMLVGRNVLQDFVTAPMWLADGAPDFVNRTDQTDGNPDSTGCGMAFISWLISQGKGLPAIVQGMVSLGDSGTFTQLYAQLGLGPAGTNVWKAFIGAVNALPNGIRNDDPFAGVTPPVPVPTPTPTPAPAPAPTILANYQAAAGDVLQLTLTKS